jgi:riboflavin biosynthesis pyrimidine reductase
VSRRGLPTLAPLETLFEAKRGKSLPLPPRLARLYGRLRMPLERSRPHVISNFVTTLDGVVSLNVKGHASGGDISGSSAQDRMVMGLLRAIADVVIVGAGTLNVDRRHVWTAERICPGLADDYRRLRALLGKPAPPLNVIVSGSGRVDLGLPVFASGEAQALIVTTTAGAKRLRKQRAPESVEICAVRQSASATRGGASATGGGASATGGGTGAIRSSSILEQVCRRFQVGSGKLILVEGGPQLLGAFYSEHALDEQFLTLAPQIAGRDVGDQRLSLVMGRTFAPRRPLWGTLSDLRRGSRHLFLRYSFP